MATGSTTKRNATRTKGAYKASRNGRHVFDLQKLRRVAAGGQSGTEAHYANTQAVVVEGERMQVGLAYEKAGCGARPHTHPNEQFNFVVKGSFRADVGARKGLLVRTGCVVHFPAGIVHRFVATPEEDGMFYVVKDLSHGIAGIPVDKRKGGGFATYAEAFGPAKRAAKKVARKVKR